ncbi:hypothetical protein EJ04DRAFT_514240 [Polyplosphaeria fusca]|uniref:Uncharacterized protein n=1 Tax=Polyplosphaeria fusca TaxID=682080 RepID=A0A9P4V156_9PLEO|nr:hypothetical protein EJ04DRAFT_514240 [Polyplosphaeria fusca]
MSTTIQSLILSASARNTQLLSALRETDTAASQLYQQDTYISDLNAQLARAAAHVKQLESQTASELADHKKYSESTFSRLAHKASGRADRFAAKAAKEEREYFDALQAQKPAQDQLAYLRQLKVEAEVQKLQFEVEARRHEDVQRELDALYASIFEGPTPGFAEEDEREGGVAAARMQCREVAKRLEREKHVAFLLEKLRVQMQGARRQLDNAHWASQMDMLGGGTYSSMKKRNHLELAESSLHSARLLQEQVRQVDAGVAELGPMNIASGSIWGDVVFDNIWSDMGMHDKIKDSERQLDRALQRLAANAQTMQGRIRDVEGELQRASQTLQKRREELQKAREEAFARVARGEQIEGADAQLPSSLDPPPPLEDEAPPAYSA